MRTRQTHLTMWQMENEYIVVFYVFKINCEYSVSNEYINKYENEAERCVNFYKNIHW